LNPADFEQEPDLLKSDTGRLPEQKNSMLDY